MSQKGSMERLGQSFNQYVVAPTTRGTCCIRPLIIFTVVIGAIALVTGILAILASQGIPSNLVNSSIAQIGLPNSIVMTSVGGMLFVVGVIAWARHHYLAASAL